MDDRPTDQHVVLVTGIEDGVTWVVCAAPMPGANGYVRIPDGHPWHGVNEELLDLEAPGGLTFGNADWIGFDTLHGNDHWPEAAILEMENLGATWMSRYSLPKREFSREWSLELIIEETKRLARLVAAFESDEQNAIASIRAAGEGGSCRS